MKNSQIIVKKLPAFWMKTKDDSQEQDETEFEIVARSVGNLISRDQPLVNDPVLANKHNYLRFSLT